MPASKRPAPGSSQEGLRRPAKKLKKRSRKVRIGTAEMYQPAQVFPDVLSTTLRYNSNMVAVDPAAASVYYNFALNGCFDFDVDNVIGNKQPLYFDELFTSDGPYRSYNVDKWTTTITVINDSVDPLLVYWAQGSSTSETDSLIEVQNRPNVRELILTQRDGDKNMGKIIAPGSMKEIWGGLKRVNPENACGSPVSNPAALTYGTLFLYNPGGLVSTPVNCWIKVTHDFHLTAQQADAIIS